MWNINGMVNGSNGMNSDEQSEEPPPPSISDEEMPEESDVEMSPEELEMLLPAHSDRQMDPEGYRTRMSERNRQIRRTHSYFRQRLDPQSSRVLSPLYISPSITVGYTQHPRLGISENGGPTVTMEHLSRYLVTIDRRYVSDGGSESSSDYQPPLDVATGEVALSLFRHFLFKPIVCQVCMTSDPPDTVTSQCSSDDPDRLWCVTMVCKEFHADEARERYVTHTLICRVPPDVGDGVPRVTRARIVSRTRPFALPVPASNPVTAPTSPVQAEQAPSPMAFGRPVERQPVALPPFSTLTQQEDESPDEPMTQPEFDDSESPRSSTPVETEPTVSSAHFEQVLSTMEPMPEQDASPSILRCLLERSPESQPTLERLRAASVSSLLALFDLGSFVNKLPEFVSINRDGTMMASVIQQKESKTSGLIISSMVDGVQCAINLAQQSSYVGPRCSKIYLPSREFGAFEWSFDSKMILMAVKPGYPSSDRLKKKPRFRDILNDTRFSDRCGPGEGLSDIVDFSMAVLEIQSKTFTFITLPNAQTFPSQFSWAPSGRSLCFIGCELDLPRPLGLRYCSNRPSHVFTSHRSLPISLNNRTWMGAWTVTLAMDSGAGKAHHSPRLSPNNRRMVFTFNPAGGPHNHCRCIRIMEYPFGVRVSRTVVDVVDRVVDDLPHPKQFVGVYDDLPVQCWFGDCKHIAFSTNNGFHRHMYILYIDEDFKNPSDSLLYIKPPRHQHYQNAPPGRPVGGCWTVMAVCENRVIVSYSSCEIVHEILIGTVTEYVDASDNSIELNWIIALPGETYFPNILLQSIVVANPAPRNYAEAAFGLCEQTLLISALKPSREAPTVVMLHGGPNTAFQDEFSITNAYTYAFACSGFNVLQVNYLGSTGYGQSPLHRLTGYLLDVDVDSCIRQIENACKLHKLNAKRLCLFGGSHSGAIGLHIMAKKQNFFCSAALRNPVCDYISMVFNSDIPDYTFHQLLAEDYCPKFDITDDFMSRLMERNPLKLAHQINTPLLLILGSEDLRVPSMPALRLKQMLESRDIACNARIYPEGHAIQSYKYLQDSFTHTYDWYVSFANTNYYGLSDTD